MHTTNLRKVGGSVMLAVPPVLLNLLRLEAGATVAVKVENGRLIVEPKPRPAMTTLSQLHRWHSRLTRKPMPAEERDRGLDATRRGRRIDHECAATSLWFRSTASIRLLNSAAEPARADHLAYRIQRTRTKLPVTHAQSPAVGESCSPNRLCGADLPASARPALCVGDQHASVSAYSIAQRWQAKSIALPPEILDDVLARDCDFVYLNPSALRLIDVALLQQQLRGEREGQRDRRAQRDLEAEVVGKARRSLGVMENSVRVRSGSVIVANCTSTPPWRCSTPAQRRWPAARRDSSPAPRRSR